MSLSLAKSAAQSAARSARESLNGVARSVMNGGNPESTLTVKSMEEPTAAQVRPQSVHGGYLEKRNEQGQWQRRYCVMVPHSFLYYYEGDQADVPRGIIDLESYHNSSVEIEEDGTKILKVAASDSSGLRTFYFKASDATPESLNEWARTLNRERYHQLRAQVGAYRDMQEKFSHEISAEMREKEQAAWTLQVEQAALENATTQIRRLINELSRDTYDDEPKNPLFGRNRSIDSSLQRLREVIADHRSRVEEKVEAAQVSQAESIALREASLESAQAETRTAAAKMAEAEKRAAACQAQMEALRDGLHQRESEAQSAASNLHIAVGERRALKQRVGQLSEQKKVLVREVKAVRAKLEEESGRRKRSETAFRGLQAELKETQAALIALTQNLAPAPGGGPPGPPPRVVDTPVEEPAESLLFGLQNGVAVPISPERPEVTGTVASGHLSRSDSDPFSSPLPVPLVHNASDATASPEPAPSPPAQIACRRCGGIVAGPRYSTCRCEEPLLGEEDEAASTVELLSDGLGKASEGLGSAAKKLSSGLGMGFTSFRSAVSTLAKAAPRPPFMGAEEVKAAERAKGEESQDYLDTLASWDQVPAEDSGNLNNAGAQVEDLLGDATGVGAVAAGQLPGELEGSEGASSGLDVEFGDFADLDAARTDLASLGDMAAEAKGVGGEQEPPAQATSAGDVVEEAEIDTGSLDAGAAPAEDARGADEPSDEAAAACDGGLIEAETAELEVEEEMTV